MAAVGRVAVDRGIVGTAVGEIDLAHMLRPVVVVVGLRLLNKLSP